MRGRRSLESPEGGAAANGSLPPQWLPPSAALSQFAPPAGARPASHAGDDESLRYGFRIAGIGLLLGQAAGAELVAEVRMAPIPNAPVWLRGLMNLRGNLVPVIDVAAALGLPAEAETSLVLVFGKGERAAGVPISAAPEALKGLNRAVQLPPLPERLAAHTGEGHMHGRDFWVEFQHESFFESLAAGGAGA